MKYWARIFLLFTLLAGSGEGTMYLYGGSDAYGQGLSYPGYSSPLSFATFVAGNNTTAISPVLLRATIFRPEFSLIKYSNRTSYYHPIQPLWDQFTFYLPFLSTQDWFSGSYDSYDTQAIRQFMKEDGYREGIEPHDDLDRMGLNRFLEDDEPPGRPLL